MNNNKSIVIGILAHVDAGKTTLSEALLYNCAVTSKIGRVDNGDAFLDTDIIEKERGITIFAKQAELMLNEYTYATLLDTPGHVDFTAEIKRSLDVLDYAILVINGRDGAREHTRTLAELLREHRIPYFVWINKTDIAGVDEDAVFKQLKEEINPNVVWFKGRYTREGFCDDCAVCDERLLDEMLRTGTLEVDSIAKSIRDGFIIPCYSGSALKNIGVDELIEGLADLTIGYTEEAAQGEPAAIVYKISRDEKGKRLTQLKLCAGCIHTRDSIDGEKINQIRLYNGSRYTCLDEARAGMVVAVTGLTSSYAGQIIGKASRVGGTAYYLGDAFELRYPSNVDAYKFLEQLRELDEELPELQLYMTEDLRILVRLAGKIQKDVVLRIIHDRYGVDAELAEYVPALPEVEDIAEEEEADYRPDLNARWAGDEKDLTQIFEMTYGPERKRTVRPARIVDTGMGDLKKQEILKEYLLIDGYNVIFAWKDLKELAKTNIDAAREAFINIIQEYKSTTDAEIIIVFDAYRVRGGKGRIEKYENIYVAYTEEAQSADSYIERMTYNIRRKYRSRVVTSDVAEQIIIMGNNSTAVSSESFRKEIELADEKIRQMLETYRNRPNIEFRNRIHIDLDNI